jgi:nitrite reductase (NADH) large subunit
LSAVLPIAFPNFMEVYPRIPDRVWYALRICTVGAVLAISGLAIFRPDIALPLFWRAILPWLPLIFFVAPGVWRNVCPLAAANQTPRLFGFSRALTRPQWLQEYSYVIGIVLFLGLASSRKLIFETNGLATGLLLLCVIGAAFTMGVIFKGKSGWCSSICPLLPIQRIYGQTPFIPSRNSHCKPCVGCTRNCYDFNPAVAYLADLHEADPNYRDYRKFFVSIFPAFILWFYLTPAGTPLPRFYGSLALYLLMGAGSFFLLEAFLKVSTHRVTAVYAVLAFNCYYWFNAPNLFGPALGLAGIPQPASVVVALRLVMLAISGWWLARTYRKESAFLAFSRPGQAARAAATAGQAPAAASGSSDPIVTVLPMKRQLVPKSGISLLELAENAGVKIEAGCRMGVCGADPIAVRTGMDCLSAASASELNTIQRLGLADNTRMACCSKVVAEGSIEISLEPDQAGAPASGAPGHFEVDTSVKRVVILGNGIGGVTAADQIRRYLPECQIDIIGRERHSLYNRMGITRLIYGRSAMSGLILQQEQWYEERNINCWLNTQATKIDVDGKAVVVGINDQLPYDRLIIASGSRGFVPKVEGSDLPGCSVLREAEDAMEIRSFAQRHSCLSAVVVGGGLLGLEAAYGMVKLGLRVTVLQRGNRLLGRQLDARGAEMLQELLSSLGINVALDADLLQVHGGDRVEGVELTDGRALDCDYVLLCAGITPNVELAKEAGIAVKRGIVVDERMRTSADGVYAVGDCAEFEGQIPGLWATAVEQGTLAALNSLGGGRTYMAQPVPTMLKVSGVDLVSIGRFDADSEDEEIVLEDTSRYRYRKLVVSEGRVVGGILLGFPDDVAALTDAVLGARVVSPSELESLRTGNWDVLAAEALAAA